ncbi:MAG: lamin tail domain-containing protein, partial [Phycisphaerae bacterium]
MTPLDHPSPARGGPVFESMEPRLLLESHPVISEFLAINSQDVYPSHPTIAETDWDWIELHNPTGSAVDLAGYHLSDDDDLVDLWTFPDDEPGLTTVEAGGYLVVYASKLSGDPHHPDPEHPDDFHCNFKLDGDGEYLALLGP